MINQTFRFIILLVSFFSFFERREPLARFALVTVVPINNVVHVLKTFQIYFGYLSKSLLSNFLEEIAYSAIL